MDSVPRRLGSPWTAIAAKIAMIMDRIRRLIRPAILLFAAGITTPGCCQISNLADSSRQLYLHTTFQTSPCWNPSTSTLLEHLGLRELALRQPRDAFYFLEEPTESLQADPHRLLALAELAFAISQDSKAQEAILWARDSAVYTVFYLAEPTASHDDEPARSLAYSLHNRAVARCLRLARTDVAPAQSTWPAQLARAGIIPTSTSEAWSALGIDSLQAVNQSSFPGRDRSDRSIALGVPLVVHRVLTDHELFEWKPYGPDEAAFAATAFLTPRGSPTTWRNQPVELSLVDPLQAERA